jgi:Endonuclease NucS C-terminal domain
MEKPPPFSLPLPRVYAFLSEKGFPTEAEVVRRSFPGKETAARRAKRGLAVEILRSKGLFEEFIAECWPNGSTDDGGKRLQRYKLCYDDLRGGLPPEGNDVDISESDDTGAAADRFAYETDLRDYLAKNLGVIEPGMALWPTKDPETAVEFRVDDNGRRIDILAKDRDGAPVVIELKVSSGHEKVIGQALYYRGSVKERFAAEKVRVIIIAREITPELKMATSDLPNVEIFEYRLSVNLTKVAERLPTAVARVTDPSR